MELVGQAASNLVPITWLPGWAKLAAAQCPQLAPAFGWDFSLSNEKDAHASDSDENLERGNWSNKGDYLLSMVGYAVGLGNVWRFPYLTYQNGGGAFLIPYTLMLALAGLPLFFMECSLGQFASLGPISVWRILPLFQGVGITMVIISTFVAIYYNVIIANALYYLFASFQKVLPWSACFSWADEFCSKTRLAAVAVLSVSLTLIEQSQLRCEALQVELDNDMDGGSSRLEVSPRLSQPTTHAKTASVWKDAATQIFYSLSVAWGGLVALSSYNKFHNNCYSDAILVCVTNCVTSVFAGFAIFSILGHMAFVSERPVSEVVDSGFDLAFVAYPEVLSRLPVSPLWSFLFFFMLLLLGLDSQFATIETLTTTIQDIYPKVMKKLRIPITLGVCILLFFLGLICVTQAGIYWVNLIDHFCAGWGILIAAVLEIIGIIYIYGGNRFIEDIEMMIGKKSRLFWLWWRMCWFFITPVLLMAILVWSLVTFSPPTYGSVLYPAWGTAVGWCMIIFCVIWIPIAAILKIVKAEGNLCQSPELP
ncbi:sodium- and chloride-dependent neutral and basic amino acid transporter B(0+)-like [Harpia harpyja]|uniref:sodium- and chloride-dependent neutral and basic amino acid transporter B(0+)-like n=1 Tax=Harpia harpyja TaxID=202280 RepID=UPI0022B1622E|nr:sodium- and chloride-dependent neutral and basic amino acid transporter B(0+)-like [Harpia harpyja]